MARTSLIAPTQVSLVFASVVTGGHRQLVPTSFSPYEIDVVRDGPGLNSTATHLETVVFAGPVGGGSGRTFTRPPQGGLSPSDILEPFELVYSLDAEAPEGMGHLVGQNNYAIKDYVPLLMGSSGTADDTEGLRNARLASFRGSLYLVGERAEAGAQGVSLHAVIYRKNSLGQLQLVHRFDDEPISTRNFVDEVGSPCVAVHGGRLYIAYRVVEADVPDNKIVVWRSDEDGLSFEKITTISLLNHPDEQGFYASYRLRLASSGDSMMLVSYGLSSVTRDGVDGLYRIRDARTYISYNDGYVFETSGDDYRPFIVQDTNSIYTRRSDANFSALFFLSDSNMDEDDFLRATCNFDLYFDRMMGQYVILKGADPTYLISSPTSVPDRTGNNRLVGISATPEDPNTWSACVIYDLNAQNIGFRTDSTDPFSFPSPDAPGESNRTNAFWIYDLSVCSNGTESFLLLVGATTHENGTWLGETLFTRFVMTPTQWLPKGFHDKVMAYGSMVHPDFAFVCDAFDIMQSGLYSIGDYRTSGTLRFLSEPCAVVHDHAVWATAKQDDGLFADTIPCFIVHGAQTTHGELFNYEFSWSHYAGSIGICNLEFTSAGSHAESLTSGGASMAATAPGGASALEIVVEQRTVMQQASNGRTTFFPFKTRCTIQAPTPASQLEIMRCYAASDDGGVSLKVFIDSSRALFFKGSDNSVLATTGSLLAPAGFFELLIYNGFGRLANGTQTYGAWAYLRPEGSMIWEGPCVIDTVSSSDPGFNDFKIGVISYDVYGAGLTVLVKTIRYSSMGAGYRPFMRPFDLSDSIEEPLARALDEELIPSRPLTLYGSKADLAGSGSLAIYGGLLTDNTRTVFSYDRVAAHNTAANVLIPVANRVHDVTLPYESSSPPLYVFENELRRTFDTIAFSNVIGVTEVTLTAGVFDVETETWTGTPASQTYTAPFMPLLIEEQDGAILTTTLLPVQTHRLRGQYAYIYNLVTGAMRTPQFKVVDNFDNLVVLDQAPTLLADETIALTYNSFAFDVPDAIGMSRASHIGVSIAAPSDTDLQLVCLGNFIAGTLVELSQASTSLGESIETSSDTVTSMNNYIHIRSNRERPLQKKTTIDFYLTNKNMVRVLSALALLKQDSVFTALVYQDSEEDQTSFGHLTELDISSMSYDKTGSLTIVGQDYLIQPAEPEPDSVFFELLISEPTFIVSTSYSLTAEVSTADPYIVTWDFGDATTDSGATVSHSWSAPGRYYVVASVALATGPVYTRSLIITVTP